MLKIMVPLALAGTFAMAGVSCDPTDILTSPGANAVFDDAAPPLFTNASVHDPSVFPARDGFYVMGSHLATARTTDFIQWKQVTRDWHNQPNMFYPVDNPDPTVQTVKDQIADVMRGEKNPLGFFAGDIHQMADGKFYHYYCLTASWYCSAIGLAIADAVEGPYITRGLIVRSGEAAEGSKTPDGVTGIWAANRYPNCIDPQAFFDNEGRFLLVYGSWSGGIFLLELDPATGLCKADAAINAENGGYGKKLIRNSHTAIEGPYIIYSPETQYYYLFVSFGGLDAKGGYNMRVFRSRSPEGPYDDAIHEDMEKNLRPTSVQDYGVKIMGGYQFKQESGEAGSGTTGYLSPGHNSVRVDRDTGKYFLIYHQRFSGRGEAHEIRVRELFITEDGWFAAAPFRYDGGTVRSFTAKELSGSWKLLNHGKDNNTRPHESALFQFRKDGTIHGGSTGGGTWELGSDGRTAHITVDGVSYKGVFLRCFDEDHNMWVQAFTALSGNGTALWGAGASIK